MGTCYAPEVAVRGNWITLPTRLAGRGESLAALRALQRVRVHPLHKIGRDGESTLRTSLVQGGADLL